MTSLNCIQAYAVLAYIVYFFFFKQKTAYEMSASLVGSEMCIRDSVRLNGYRHSGTIVPRLRRRCRRYSTARSGSTLISSHP